jgi:hypothetical protein
MLNRALGLPSEKPKWFAMPVMRRIAISTPSVMTALRRLRRDQARPYNFALSPVLVNLTDNQVTLLAPFEKDSSRWMTMPYVNIHDGSTHTLSARSTGRLGGVACGRGDEGKTKSKRFTVSPPSQHRRKIARAMWMSVQSSGRIRKKPRHRRGIGS